MSWLLLGLALILSNTRGVTGRHRPVGATGRAGTPRRSALAWAVTVLVPMAAGLLTGPVGLLVAVPAGLAAAVVVRRPGQQVRQPIDRLAVAYLLDLLAAVLQSGAPTDQAIEAVARCVREHGDGSLRRAMEQFALVGRLLRLGTEPQQAWHMLADRAELVPVASAARRCATSGARLAGALAETADLLRALQRQQALVRAQRAGVWALLPLGCCFLPAFVCIGVIPVVVGLAGQVLPH